MALNGQQRVIDVGIVDPHEPGIAEAISHLLTRSISDAEHLPGWLIDDIKRIYTSAHSIRTLWAKTGHRFVARVDGEIVATLHVARDHDNIFTLNRQLINVREKDHPGFKPPRYHQCVNISVKHELRRKGIATELVNRICTEFRDLFAGDGLWFRADWPWRPGLEGLGFVYDPSGDHHLPDGRLQYVSMSRPFAKPRSRRVLAVSASSITVESGCTWDQVLSALPSGVIPPVVTAWLGATVGGTLATRGFGKGSFENGFQTEHAECKTRHGFITEATLRLVPALPFVNVTTSRGLNWPTKGYHVSAFADGEQWNLVVATQHASEGIPLMSYLRGARPQSEAAFDVVFEKKLPPSLAHVRQIVPIRDEFALILHPRKR